MRAGAGVAALLAWVVLARLGSAQTYACQPAMANATIVLRNHIVRVTGNPAYDRSRVLYHLPRTSSSSVQAVTQAEICQDSAIAYHAAVRGASAPPVSRQVVVLKVGATRYVVLDPEEREGEFTVTVIFDSSFQPLSSFNS